MTHARVQRTIRVRNASTAFALVFLQTTQALAQDMELALLQIYVIVPPRMEGLNVLILYVMIFQEMKRMYVRDTEIALLQMFVNAHQATFQSIAKHIHATEFCTTLPLYAMEQDTAFLWIIVNTSLVLILVLLL